MKLNIYNPQVFQGRLNRSNYFEGWYYKHVSGNLEEVYSFIPGISLNENNSHAFIQVINGVTGKTDYISYSVDQFSASKEKLWVKIGKSVFTENSIKLDIESEGLIVKGDLEYSNLVKYPKKIFSPGIMGWYSFIPFMECKHGIVSVNHNVKGRLRINGREINFDNGKGYIEKDWGTSFPEAWIWIQANNFKDQNVSFNFSVAKIPWFGKFFLGFIAFLYYNNRFYLYSTYNNSKITSISQSNDSLEITLRNSNTILKIQASRKSFGELIAPVSGDMSRRIKESVDSEVKLELSDLKGNLIYADFSQRAGLEIIDKIFDYLNR